MTITEMNGRWNRDWLLQVVRTRTERVPGRSLRPQPSPQPPAQPPSQPPQSPPSLRPL